jgi:hypothetical protein
MHQYEEPSFVSSTESRSTFYQKLFDSLDIGLVLFEVAYGELHTASLPEQIDSILPCILVPIRAISKHSFVRLWRISQSDPRRLRGCPVCSKLERDLRLGGAKSRTDHSGKLRSLGTVFSIVPSDYVCVVGNATI